jgi:carbonic anhydrase
MAGLAIQQAVGLLGANMLSKGSERTPLCTHCVASERCKIWVLCCVVGRVIPNILNTEYGGTTILQNVANHSPNDSVT